MSSFSSTPPSPSPNSGLQTRSAELAERLAGVSVRLKKVEGTLFGFAPEKVADGSSTVNCVEDNTNQCHALAAGIEDTLSNLEGRL